MLNTILKITFLTFFILLFNQSYAQKTLSIDSVFTISAYKPNSGISYTVPSGKTIKIESYSGGCTQSYWYNTVYVNGVPIGLDKLPIWLGPGDQLSVGTVSGQCWFFLSLIRFKLQ